MVKTWATLLLAASGSLACAGQAQACNGHCCGSAPCCGATATANTGMQTAQGGQTYQSFSYEPGTSTAPMMTSRATAPARYGYSAQQNVLRGDKKVRELYR